MCYFLTIGVPDEAANAFESAISRGLAAHRMQNPSIEAVLPKDVATYVLISGMCSCDLYTPEREPPNRQTEITRLRRKYARLGWSEAKIDRAVAGSISKGDARRGREPGLRDDVRQLLSQVVADARELYVVVHFCHADPGTERVATGRGPDVDARAFAAGAFELAEGESRRVVAGRW